MPTKTQCVTVTGTGSAAGVPDVAVVSVRVYIERDSIDVALSDAATAVREAGEVLKANDIAAKDRSTTDIVLNPRYDHSRSDGVERIVGYAAYQSLSVRVRKLNRLGTLLTALAATSGDALRVDGLSLELSATEELTKAARQAAFADAKDKAEQYARISGMPLGQVISIEESTGGYAGFAGDSRRVKLASASPMPIEAGERQVGVTVSVTWELGDSNDENPRYLSA